MRVSFDIDGVLADFVWSFTNEAHILNGYAPDEIKENVEVFGTLRQKEWKFPWSEQFYEDVWARIDTIQNWWMSLDPLVSQKDINAINYTIHNNDVYFITSRKSTAGLNIERQCQYWLDGIGIDASHATVIATQAGKKHKLMNAMDIDCHIDDKPSIVKDIHHHSKAHSCVIDRPYNQDIPGLGFNPIRAFATVEEYCEWITQHSRSIEKN